MSEVELVEGAQATYQGFLNEESEMYADRDYDYTRLLPFVSAELATSVVTEAQRMHDDGLDIQGAAIVIDVGLHAGSTEGPIAVDVCIDASDTRVLDVESGADLEITSSQVTAWRLGLEVTGDRVLVDTHEPLASGAMPSCL